MPAIHSATRAANTLRDHFGVAPFTRADALTVVSARCLRTAVANGTVVRVRHGAYAVADDPPDLEQYRCRIQAALAARPDAVATHESALALHGLSLPWFGAAWADRPVWLNTAADRASRSDLVVRARAMPDHHVTRTEHGPATTPGRTSMDLARVLPFRLALIAADECSALALLQGQDWDGGLADARRYGPQFRRLMAGNAGRATDELHEVLADAPYQRGLGAARRVARWVDPAAESPGESLSRAQLIAAGLPRPTVGFPVTGDDGSRYYADLAWVEHGVLGDVDGYGKYGDDAWGAFRHEKRREDSLRAQGWSVVRWTVTLMLHEPHLAVARVRRALAGRSTPAVRG